MYNPTVTNTFCQNIIDTLALSGLAPTEAQEMLNQSDEPTQELLTELVYLVNSTLLSDQDLFANDEMLKVEKARYWMECKKSITEYTREDCDFTLVVMDEATDAQGKEVLRLIQARLKELA